MSSSCAHAHVDAHACDERTDRVDVGLSNRGIHRYDLKMLYGRWPRSWFWAATAGLLLMTIVVAGTDSANTSIFQAVAGLVYLLLVAPQRFRDLNRPGWHAALLLIPIYNLYVGLDLAFARGTRGTNLYGSDPLADPQRTKTRPRRIAEAVSTIQDDELDLPRFLGHPR